jgi:hypothetical protein
MNRILTRTNRAVRRHNAQNYMLIMLISFSASVILTRLVLTLTGSPQIAVGDFHIAHLLWGGLLLFISSILMLTLSNMWAYSVGALTSGIGVGLFIDEVGKFITKTNDYFYPLAIPIIYAFFLLTVLLYLRSRRPDSHDPRAELYRCLDMFHELLDHDLEPTEREDLERHLNSAISRSTTPDLTAFAQTLLDFLKSKEVKLAPEHPSGLERLARWARKTEESRLGRKRLKVLLTVGLAALGVFAFAELLTLVGAAAVGSQMSLSHVMRDFASQTEIKSTVALNWYLLQLVMEGVIGVILLAASLLLIVGRDKQGNEVGYVGLLFSLTIVNLLIFYFEQFGNVLLTLFELLLLLGIIQYRSRYIEQQPSQVRTDC